MVRRQVNRAWLKRCARLISQELGQYRTIVVRDKIPYDEAKYLTLIETTPPTEQAVARKFARAIKRHKIVQFNEPDLPSPSGVASAYRVATRRVSIRVYYAFNIYRGQMEYRFDMIGATQAGSDG